MCAIISPMVMPAMLYMLETIRTNKKTVRFWVALTFRYLMPRKFFFSVFVLQ
jgi:hypothetical protein